MISGTILAALALIAVVVTAWYSRRRLQEIHVLVNRRLEVALQEIRELKQAREETRDRDHPRDQESGSAPVTPSDAGRADDG